MCNNWKAQLFTFTDVTYENIYDKAHIQLYVHMIKDRSSSTHLLHNSQYTPIALNHIIHLTQKP